MMRLDAHRVLGMPQLWLGAIVFDVSIATLRSDLGERHVRVSPPAIGFHARTVFRSGVADARRSRGMLSARRALREQAPERPTPVCGRAARGKRACIDV